MNSTKKLNWTVDLYVELGLTLIRKFLHSESSYTKLNISTYLQIEKLTFVGEQSALFLYLACCWIFFPLKAYKFSSSLNIVQNTQD